MSAVRTRPVTAPATSPVLLAHLTRLSQVATRKNPATAVDADSNAIYMGRLISAGLVEAVGKVQTGKRGRPALKYAPTKLGRDRARRAVAKQA